MKADFINVGPKVNVKVSANGGSSYQTLQTGQLNWKEISGGTDTLVGVGNNFSTYCIDITQYVADPTLFTITSDPSAVPDPTGAAGSLATAWVGDTSRTKAFVLGQLYRQFYSTVDTAAEAAGFQLAIWKIAFETQSSHALNLALGDVRAKDAATAIPQSQTYLTWVSINSSALSNVAGFTYLTTGTGQDQLFYQPPSGGDLPTIPLPSALMGGGVLLAGMVTRRLGHMA